MKTTSRRARVLERSADGGAVTLSVLPDGLRVITESVPGSRSASVGIWVGVGSIDETSKLAGASHYLEHLLFKGTRTRTGQEISEAIDSVGGELNAFTSHEYTCYFAHVLADEAQMAVDLVCDVVLDALVTSADVDIERQVILEEIAMRDDDPEDVLNDLFSSTVFAGSSLALPVIGSIESVENITRGQISGYYRRRYTPSKMVVSVAGGIEHGEVLRWVKKAFAGVRAADATPMAPRSSNPGRLSGRGALALVDRDTEQAHLCVGNPGLSRHDPRRHALGVFNAALGGGMSSRLFRAIREERGLAYSCYSSSAAYAGSGSFSVYAGCVPENLGEVVKVLRSELTAARTGLTVDELRRAKGQLIGSMILGLEDNESRMSRIGKNVLVRGDYRSVQSEIDAIRSVTQEQILDVVHEVFAGPVSAAVVGPYAKTKDLPKELAGLVG